MRSRRDERDKKLKEGEETMGAIDEARGNTRGRTATEQSKLTEARHKERMMKHQTQSMRLGAPRESELSQDKQNDEDWGATR